MTIIDDILYKYNIPSIQYLYIYTILSFFISGIIYAKLIGDNYNIYTIYIIIFIDKLLTIRIMMFFVIKYYIFIEIFLNKCSDIFNKIKN